jgi:hypothetical protein
MFKKNTEKIKTHVSCSVHYILVHQYSETNVNHFLFNLLIINGLYMFRALLAHLQECAAQTALGILHACYITLVQPTDITPTQYTKCHLCNASSG